MDRSKWEYKKLGEVCTVVSGSTPKTQVEEYWNGNHYWITPAELDGSTYVSKSGRLITDAAIEKTNLTLLPIGTVLLSSRAPIGKVAITTVPMYCNQGFKNLICSDAIFNKYLYWFLKVNTEYLNSLGRGATFKEISKTSVENIKIPVYSIEDQQRVVAELDCLNEMIALKQEQLKEFDKLAQSIFYDMFGDPVTNEKGWDVIELGTRCEVTSFKRVLIEDVVDSGVPFIRGTELMALSKATKGEKIDFTLFITPEHYEQVKAISGVPAVGDLLIPSINSEGNIWILDTDEPRYYKDGRVLWVHVNHDAYTSEALKFIMHILLKKTYSVMATGATFAELKLFVLRELKTILPPLARQQQFAEKIQAIEAQKELVKKSIAETQHLLDSRMDYYFD